MAGREGPRGTVGTPGRPVLSPGPRFLAAGVLSAVDFPGSERPGPPEQPEAGYDPLALGPSFLKMTAHAADLRLRSVSWSSDLLPPRPPPSFLCSNGLCFAYLARFSLSACQVLGGSGMQWRGEIQGSFFRVYSL